MHLLHPQGSQVFPRRQFKPGENWGVFPGFSHLSGKNTLTHGAFRVRRHRSNGSARRVLTDRRTSATFCSALPAVYGTSLVIILVEIDK